MYSDVNQILLGLAVLENNALEVYKQDYRKSKREDLKKKKRKNSCSVFLCPEFALMQRLKIRRTYCSWWKNGSDVLYPAIKTSSAFP